MDAWKTVFSLFGLLTIANARIKALDIERIVVAVITRKREVEFRAHFRIVVATKTVRSICVAWQFPLFLQSDGENVIFVAGTNEPVVKLP